MLLSGHKFNKMNRPVGGWKGSAVRIWDRGQVQKPQLLSLITGTGFWISISPYAPGWVSFSRGEGTLSL